MFTRFYDVSTAGRRKTPYKLIYIAGCEEAAVAAFIRLFERDPRTSVCPADGPDFDIEEIDCAPWEDNEWGWASSHEVIVVPKES